MKIWESIVCFFHCFNGRHPSECVNRKEEGESRIVFYRGRYFPQGKQKGKWSCLYSEPGGNCIAASFGTSYEAQRCLAKFYERKKRENINPRSYLV